MHKVRVEIELPYDGVLGIEPEMPLSQAHRNSLMREAVYIQVKDALTQYGFQPEIKSVVKLWKVKANETN